MHQLWLIPTSLHVDDVSTVLRQDDAVAPIAVDLVNSQLPVHFRRYGAPIIELDDKVHLLHHARRPPPSLLVEADKPQRWASCCSPTIHCVGGVISFGRQCRVVLTVLCTFTPTTALPPEYNAVSETAAASLVAAALVALHKPLCRVLLDGPTLRSSKTSALDVLVAWRAYHAMSLTRWAARCARWLQQEPSRLHGTWQDTDALLTDPILCQSLVELEQMPAQPKPSCSAARTWELASHLVLTSAQRRLRTHVDPHATQPVPVGQDIVDASLRTAWQQLMALSHGFVERTNTPSVVAAVSAPPATTDPPPQAQRQQNDDSHVSAKRPTNHIASSHLLIQHSLREEDAVEIGTGSTTSSGSRAQPVLQSTQTGGDEDGKLAERNVIHAEHSTEWYFHRSESAAAPEAEDDVLMHTTTPLEDNEAAPAGTDADSPLPVDDDEEKTFTCSSTPRGIAAPSALHADWPSHAPPPLRLVVCERITLRAHTTTADVIPRAHRIEGDVRVAWSTDAATVLRSNTPADVIERSDASGLPLEGYWRLAHDLGHDPCESAADYVASFKLVLRVSGRWMPPRDVTLDTLPQTTNKFHTKTSGDSSNDSTITTSSSSSSDDSDTDDENRAIWCPGDWTWSLPHDSSQPQLQSQSQQFRNVPVLLLCTPNYQANELTMAVASFTLGSFQRDQQLRKALRVCAPAFRPNVAALREVKRSMEQSWMPVDCRGRWVLEMRAPSDHQTRGDTTPSELALLFKGIIALRDTPTTTPLFSSNPVTCTFHPRVVPTDESSATPMLVAQGRPEFDVIKFKPKKGVGTIGWRHVAQSCSQGGAMESNLLRLPIAARIVYSEPHVVRELLSMADRANGPADTHSSLHIHFVDVPSSSVSGVEMEVSSGGGPLPVTTLLSSGEAYTFDFDRAQLLRR
ncbi:Hypothetical protein, putative [Bodo saltans]|uniref:Uncharacterized protein n=1 Tax=Bodo saltans TaxID=75058 RepID=A0A0S4J0M9_BODSA|nr:Hypothetical protein, putative [Bodo saltans]|eukprot:CUG06447.1 Hypothetical protein, putative [Bodo saltans]